MSLSILFFNFRTFLTSWISGAFIDIIIYSFAGAIGSFISVTGRIEKINMNASAGIFIHCVDSCVRVVIGVLESFLVILAIQSQLLFGNFRTLSSSNLNYIYVVIAILCGESERLVPNIIETLENKISKNQKPQERKTEGKLIDDGNKIETNSNVKKPDIKGQLT